MALQVQDLGKKFGPGDPMARDRFSMGIPVGSNLMILARQHGTVTNFEVVDMKDGHTIHVDVVDNFKPSTFPCPHCGEQVSMFKEP